MMERRTMITAALAAAGVIGAIVIWFLADVGFGDEVALSLSNRKDWVRPVWFAIASSLAAPAAIGIWMASRSRSVTKLSPVEGLGIGAWSTALAFAWTNPYDPETIVGAERVAVSVVMVAIFGALARETTVRRPLARWTAWLGVAARAGIVLAGAVILSSPTFADRGFERLLTVHGALIGWLPMIVIVFGPDLLVARRERAALPPTRTVEPMSLAASERVSYLATVPEMRWLVPLGAVSVVLANGLVLIGGIAAIAGLLRVLHVKVTDEEITVGGEQTSIWVVPIGEVRGAEVLDVSPLRDFGGWRQKWKPDADAYIARRGQAVRIRRDGRDMILAVPDAARIASLIEGLIQRRDRSGPEAGSRAGQDTAPLNGG